MDLSSVEEIKAQLFARLPESGPQYWEVFSKFLCFQSTKEEFDSKALTLLGPHVALHNALVFAMLRAATEAKPVDKSAAAATTTSEPRAGVKRERSDMAPPGAASSSAGATDVAAGAAAAPKLMLKIGLGNDGGLAVSSQRPELTVDPLEEDRLNALNDRLIELAKQNGLAGVAPEAVSFMQRAVKAQAHRMIVAAALGNAGDGPGATEPVARTVGAEDIYGAIRQPAPAVWMAPPCQRSGSTLGSSGKFSA